MKTKIWNFFFLIYLFFSTLTLVRGDQSILTLPISLTYALSLLMSHVLLLNIVLNKPKLKKENTFWFFLYILVLSLSSTLTAVFWNDINSLIKYYALLINSIVLFIAFKDKSPATYSSLEIWANFNILTSIIVSFIILLGFFQIDTFFSLNNYDELIRPFPIHSTSGIFFEPNITAYQLLFGFYFILKKNKRILNFILPIIFFGILLTYSRAIIVLSIILLLRKYKILIFLLLILVTFFSVKYFDLMKEVLNINNLLTGRPEMWFSILNDLDKFIFGLGFNPQRLNEYLTPFGENYVTSHNIFLDMLMTNGFIAFIFYITLFIWLLNRKINNNKGHIFFSLICFMFLFISPSNFGGLSLVSVNSTILFLINYE